LKAAILGTSDYHATMREIVDTSLRHRINYVPQRMSVDSNCILPPVHPNYLYEIDLKIQEFGDEWITNCNPRSPYLLMAWLLIGSDNKYRACQYVDEMNITKHVAIIHIRIALGDMPLSGDLSNAVRISGDMGLKTEKNVIWTAWRAIWAAARAAEDYTHIGAVGSVARETDAAARISGLAENQDVAWDTICNKSREWAHITDEEALQIAHQLTLDILSL
jgi:hypothetical protein